MFVAPRTLIPALALAAALAAAPGVAADTSHEAPADAPHVRPGRAPAGRAEKVFGNDDRAPIFDPTVYPYSAVVSLEITFPNGQFALATGAMVGPRQVLTAAHAVHSFADGGTARDVRVIPGYDFGYEPFGSESASRVHVLPEWVATESPDFDVAVLELPTSLGLSTGWFGLADFGDSVLTGHAAVTAGYPVDLDGGEGMWTAAGVIESVSTARLFYRGTLDTAPGQSGSPLWVRDGGQDFLVVGVVTGSTPFSNEGTRLSNPRWAAVNAWLDGYDGPADLSVDALSHPFGSEAAPGRAGNISVTVANSGDAPADARLEVFLDGPGGVARELGRSRLVIFEGESLLVQIPSQIPADVDAGVHRIRAVLTALPSSPDPFPGDNVLVSSAFDVRLLERVLPVGSRTRDTVLPGQVVRYRFGIDPGTSRLKLKLWGRAGRRVTVIAPSGARFVLGGPSGVSRIFAPEPGVWQAVVENLAARPRAIRFLAKAR